jgi:ribosomal-protein-alanine N-acetyltransferase
MDRNLAAKRLYESNGYREVGRRPRYYADGADAVLLRLDLTPDAATPG